MAVTTGTRSSIRRLPGLSAIALGAALLALPGAAFAQQDDHHGDHGGNGAPHEQQAPRPAPAAPAPRAAPAPMERGGNMREGPQWNAQARAPQQNYAPRQPANQGQPAFQGRPAYQGQPGYQGQPRGDDARRNDGGQWHDDRGQWHNDGGRGAPGYAGRGGSQWNPGWRQDNRYDWRGWRAANRDSFHVGRYYPPYRGYGYNRLGIGFYLQPLFFGSDYWIADPWYYHLPPAYGPYHWVRYYNDAVLVNTYDGQVADVIYDFFW